MTQIVDFTQEQKLKFVAFTPIFTKSGVDVKKTYPALLKDWNKKNFTTLNKHYEANGTSEKFILINCTNEFIIFDTDTKEDYIKLVTILKELDLYNNATITKSARGDVYPYKRHFWFAIEEDEFLEMKKHKFGDMEVFIGSNCSIAERIESTLEELNILSYDMYNEIKNAFIPLVEYEEEEEEKEEEKEEVKPVIKEKKAPIKPLYENDPNLPILMENMAPKRFQNFNDWISIYWTFLNEKFDMDLFEQYSKKHYKKYNKEANEKIYKTSKPCDGFKIATLYHYVHEDNYKVFVSLQKTRTDFWAIFENLKNHSDPAKLYYSIKPNQYVRCEVNGWYEYNQHNIMISTGKEVPSSMLNDITSTLQDLLIEQRNLILPKSKQDTEYEKAMKMFKSAYDKVGTSKFVKDIIDYLKHLYIVPKISELIDGNVNVIAFENMLYDNSIKDFRPIKPIDYISKTTGYAIKIKSNSAIREYITKFIRSMFNSDELYNYHMLTIALSLFGNKQEAFYINSGNGRNGKGVCSTMIERALGAYFYTGESNFLTSVYKAGVANSTLANLKGVRYFLTTEPEANDSSSFNMGLIKQITGNDIIATRDLHKSNILYKPQFTPFLQCNTKPNIDKVDDALRNRFRIINFPFAFVANPDAKKPNEKQNDPNLKSTVSAQSTINEFMLLLLDISKSIPEKIEVPKEVLGEVNNYLNQNNHVKLWLDNSFKLSDDKKHCHTAKYLLDKYNESGDYPFMTNTKFSRAMEMNKIPHMQKHHVKYYYGLEENLDYDSELDDKIDNE